MKMKTIAAQAVADAIADAVPELADPQRCAAGEDDEEEVAEYPSLRVLPRVMEFMPWQEEMVDDQGAADLTAHELVKVGDFDGQLELRLFCKSKTERDLLEQSIVDLFMAREGAPGSLVALTPPLVLNGRATLQQAEVSCFLDEVSWEDELVFAKKRMSTLRVPASFPLHVLRSAPIIDELRIILATGLDDAAPSEVVSIDEDGVITPST